MERNIIIDLGEHVSHNLAMISYEMQNLGITHVGHGLIYPKKTATAFFSSPEWGAQYKEQDFFKRDPVRLCALHTSHRIIPWDSILVDQKEKVILEERMRYFKTKRGVLLSLKTPSFHETLVVGIDSNKLGLSDLFGDNLNLLYAYLMQLRQAHMGYYKN